MIYTQKIQEAIELAIKVHEKQKRKGKNIPYVTHPLTVALILSQAGASEELVIAGILHDVVEDSTEENKVTLEMIAEQFGDEVRELVGAVSESDKSLSWEERKEDALGHISSFSHDALLLKSADIISNVSELLVDYEKEGFKTFDRFNAPGEKIVEHAKDAIKAIIQAWSKIPTWPDLITLSRQLNGVISEDTSPIYYYYSSQHEKKVKIDIENNIAFIRDENGNELQAEQGNKVVAAALIENFRIRSSEY